MNYQWFEKNLLTLANAIFIALYYAIFLQLKKGLNTSLYPFRFGSFDMFILRSNMFNLQRMGILM